MTPISKKATSCQNFARHLRLQNLELLVPYHSMGGGLVEHINSVHKLNLLHTYINRENWEENFQTFIAATRIASNCNGKDNKYIVQVLSISLLL